jgi:hypothetical protein
MWAEHDPHTTSQLMARPTTHPPRRRTFTVNLLKVGPNKCGSPKKWDPTRAGPTSREAPHYWGPLKCGTHVESFLFLPQSGIHYKRARANSKLDPRHDHLRAGPITYPTQHFRFIRSISHNLLDLAPSVCVYTRDRSTCLLWDRSTCLLYTCTPCR